MSDLISRSELLKEIEKYKFGAISNDAEREYIKKTILDFIICQPTAYDIGNVVVELNELDVKAIKRYKNGNFGDYEGTDYYIKKIKAIEIVKQGIVSDDVCEWEKGFSGYVGYPAYYSKCCTTNSKGLEMQTHIIADWKFCPYCGKKIKIVGD